MNAIIVDDEERARSILRKLLAEYCPEVNVVADCDDVPSAAIQINRLKPDLVFLDIEMPGYSGFELLDMIGMSNISFEVVFTTAYQQYALKAFEVSAVGYLLKPIQITQLIQVVNRVKDLRNAQDQSARLQVLKFNLENLNDPKPKRVALPVTDGVMFVDVERIVCIIAEGNYSHIHLSDGSKLFVTKKLKDLEALLHQPSFYRSHRSFLINTHHIERYLRKDGGYLLMTNGQEIELARDRKEELLKLMGLSD